MLGKPIKIISEMSGLHHSLVQYLKQVDSRCSNKGVTRIRVHSLRQTGDICKLSVEVRTELHERMSYLFFNVLI